MAIQEDERLIMSFEPKTIEHLGVKMYSTLPPALAEMIANSYDACAKNVSIKLYDEDVQNKTIIIEDDGIGMSFNEVNEFFLRIGRNRREEGFKQTNCDRIATGKKGLGKLALFGLGNRIVIETIQAYKGVKFTMDWDEILSCTETYYSPNFELTESQKEHGTTIYLESLSRVSPYSLDALAISLSMLFNFSDQDFNLVISLNDSESIVIDSKLKYQNIDPEFEWDYNEILNEFESSYEYKDQIQGLIMTTEKPLKPGMRGITLYSNGRMINSPEFFGPSESSHFFSYATGWLNVDFVDNWEEDLISTNRQSIDWENEKTLQLREYLKTLIIFLERKWRESRREKRRRSIEIKTHVDLKKWYEALPDDVQPKIENIVNAIDNSELSEQNQASTVQHIHDLIPEYPNLHWRYIHPEIKKVSEKYYIGKDYYTAFLEALKRYISEVRKKSGSTNGNDRSLMGEVFSNRKLSVTKKYKKTDGSSFSPNTVINIEEGQHYLSEGAVVGGRNPLSHEEHFELNTTGLFTEKDCLDFLSLLSHLFKRLEDSVVP